MTWPYHFLELTAEERHQRRVTLDRYGFYAQISAVAVIVCLQVLPLARWIVRKTAAGRVEYDAVPTADAGKPREKGTTRRSWVRRTFRRGVWWLGGEVRIGTWTLGKRDEWVFGAAWTMWLLFLCVNQTGQDYHHLTKRFGQIATSQFPLQYLLAAKRINPVSLAFRTSHEAVNRWHRVLGSVAYGLALLHGLFYLNFYFHTGGLGAAFLRKVPVLGMSALAGMTLLSGTALAAVRAWSYRVFIVVHLLVALALPPVIWFHVHHARLFMAETFVVYLADVAVRMSMTLRTSAVVELVPGTDLVKIVAKAPPEKLRRFAAYPASHAYLSMAGSWRPSLLSNPFTVASVEEDKGELTFVLRRRAGPLTRRLFKLASTGAVSVKLNIDGPYGVSAHFPNFAGPAFDRVLLVAGGVGATFITPLYENIIAENPAAGVQLVWAVRDAAEATWARSAADDERVHLCVTGGRHRDSTGGSSSEGIEVEDIEMDSMEKTDGTDLSRRMPVQSRRRPNMQGIVDEVFSQDNGGRVAVVVCGPEQMARDVRKALGFWVGTGRDVWFHNESFGW